jgi:hypothetical protein
MNGAGEPLGKREVNLLHSVPCMPTLQAMHRALAKHPMLQVRLFLLMDELVHSELLCMEAFIGLTKYGHRDAEPTREDDFASNGQIGIAEIPRSALKPLEAQGRGFTHGHEKVISVPRTRAARLKQLFAANATERGEDELTQWCQQTREAVLRAACTLQYDSAVLTGTQLGVTLRPEPFTKQQQKRSRFDGQVEEADDSAPLRPIIAITQREPNGHIRTEEEMSIAEQRPMRNPYKELPLTGATQSMMPMYRRSDSFGQVEVPDEYGYYPGDATERTNSSGWIPHGKEYVVDPSGGVTAFRMPDGEQATPEQIQDDCIAWSTSFARDQRANFIQNHDHDCTNTCVKYEKKKKKGNATEPPQRSGQKLTGPEVPKCRFRFYRTIPLSIAGFIKYVIRRGKDLVKKAFIATGNDENEYGKAMVPRDSPFRSSSDDVLQATLRCNADKQYQKRSVPDLHATEQDPPSHTGASRPTMPSLCGIGRRIGATGRRIMTTLATAMRAAHVADFYMTKYASKAQEALGPLMQPLAACMRRIVAAENEPDAAETTLIQRARLRIRRFIFSANNTMWFSACELGVFLATGASCVHTEKVTKVFSGKGIAMMHECKRMLNHSTSDQGLLCASRTTGRTEASAMHTFMVPQPLPEDTDSDASSDATESNADESNAGGNATERATNTESNADGNDTERATKKRRSDEATKDTVPLGAATEHTDYLEDCGDEAFPQVITATGSHITVANASGKTQMFTKSIAHRDDWLHRGEGLRDMDYYHYARYIERVEKPRKGTAHAFQKRHGVY